MDYDIYGDVAERTGGDIYIGVVGPVRTGKSTFITKFMEELVLPNMEDGKKTIAVDEMPQSGSGKTVTTTEPKFVPSEAVSISVGEKNAKVRLIDCVGFMVDGALGGEENGEARLVSTPWKDRPVPFSEAAAIGTEKVIRDHSTIGVVVTTDGSFTDVKREAYAEKETAVIDELKSLNKPFIVLFNTTKPSAAETKKTCDDLQRKYGVTVVAADVLKIDKQGLEEILGKVLEEFPIRVLNVDIPDWIKSLPLDGEILSTTVNKIKEASKNVFKMKDCALLEKTFDDSDVFEPIEDYSANMATGEVRLTCKAKNGIFFRAVSEAAGEPVQDETALINYVKELTVAKKGYAKIKDALSAAEEDGYGIVEADFSTSTVGEPEIVKKSGQYCVKMRVSGKSVHIIRADLIEEVEPVYGSKEQCENFLSLMEREGYDATVFGRKVSDLVDENLQKKSTGISDNLKTKIKRVVTKAANEKRTGLIYILI